MCRLIALVVLLGLASAGCSRAVVSEQGPTVAPAGYSLPKGAEEVVSPGMDPDLTVEVRVGGLVKMDDYAYQHALDAQIWSVLRLAQVNGETAIYQAVAPGTVSLVISPHGYSCPPLVQDCDTDTRGPLKLLVVVKPT